jgi:uncharacterized Ntn-hydrolase superfamily protein
VTYSIVARDPETGDLGAAVQSHWFAAGDAIWARPGVGAVATQATAFIPYGSLGLDLLASGKAAAEALAERLAADEQPEVRQVAILDGSGRVAAHTGADCIREAGHRTGDGFSCQANMMHRSTVWDAMATTFAATEGDLAERLLQTLEAAEADGGDLRGRQAARILVVRAEPTDEPWDDVLVDLRVDDHPDPLLELRRLLTLKRAYDLQDEAEDAMTEGDLERAERMTEEALRLAPGNPEISFWAAVGMASIGMIREARSEMLPTPFAADPGWRELLLRLGEQRLFGLTPESVAQLVAEGPD